MPKPVVCPRCGSLKIQVLEAEDLFFVKCRSCGYDELGAEVLPEQRTSQREKARYSPYKTGGKGRTAGNF